MWCVWCVLCGHRACRSVSQVARGFANNSKCTKGKTHLVELGAMPAILHLAAKRSLTTVRKHAMLALCQIASCAANVKASVAASPPL